MCLKKMMWTLSAIAFGSVAWNLNAASVTIQTPALCSVTPEVYTAPDRLTYDEVQGIVILVKFKGEGTPSVARAAVDSLMNGVNYSDANNMSSIYDYFYTQSHGKFKLKMFVTDYYELPRTRTEYAGQTDPQLPLSDVLDSVKRDHADVLANLSTRDGKGPAVCIFYNGLSEATGNAIFPAYTAYTTPVNSINGTLVKGALLAGVGKPPSIGVYAHELGHLLFGFKDFYVSNQVGGVSTHDLMANGSELNGQSTGFIAPISAYYKLALGWVTVEDLTTGTITLNSRSDKVYRHRKSGTSKEYFLFENRAYNDGDPSHDAVKDEGLLIWHVDESLNGNDATGNQNTGWIPKFELALEQADGRSSLEQSAPGWSDATDYYPYGNNNAFTPTSVPNSTWKDGSQSGLYITNISPAAQTMTADIFIEEKIKPVILPEDPYFSDRVEVSLHVEDEDMLIFYTLDGSIPDTSLPHDGSTRLYAESFPLDTTAVVTALAYKEGITELLVDSKQYISYPTIRVISPEAKRYPSNQPLPIQIVPDTGKEGTYGLLIKLSTTTIPLQTQTRYQLTASNNYTISSAIHQLSAGYRGYANENMRYEIYKMDGSTGTLVGYTPPFSVGTFQDIVVQDSVLNLKQGETAQIVLTDSGKSGQPVAYQSLRSAIASVNPTTGVVRAVSPGTVRIQLDQVGTGDYLSAPSQYVTVNVTVSEVVVDFPDSEFVRSEVGGVRLKWKPNGKSYELLRSETANGTYTSIETNYVSGEEYLDVTAIPGKTYYYKLRARE